MKLLKWIVEYCKTPPWTENPAEVFIAAAAIQVFLSFIMFSLVSALLVKMRKGPLFISGFLVAIFTVAVCILVVQVGVIYQWFHSAFANCVATFFFCVYTFLDIEIYWTFTIFYYDVSDQLKMKLDLTECNDQQE